MARKLFLFFIFLETRSNSLAVGTISPGDVFGSLVSDTEDFLEDLKHRHSASSDVSSPQSPRMRRNSSALQRKKDHVSLL